MDEVIVQHCASRPSQKDYFSGVDHFMGRLMAGVVMGAGVFGVGNALLFVVIACLVHVTQTLDQMLVGTVLECLLLRTILSLSVVILAFALAFMFIGADQMAVRQWEHDQIIFAEYAAP
jgi:ABC-type antimicrobial peptide transport system permease subunit